MNTVDAEFTYRYYKKYLFGFLPDKKAPKMTSKLLLESLGAFFSKL